MSGRFHLSVTALLRWVRNWGWKEWEIEQIPPPPVARHVQPVERHRARLVAISAPARRAKGQSQVQRHALKRRAHLQSMRSGK